MDKTGIVLSGNPTFNAPITINIFTGNRSLGGTATSQTEAAINHESDYLPLKRSKVADFYNHRGNKKYYQIRSYPKGRVLLVNNEFFDECSTRSGSSKDLYDMTELWDKMGCEVTILRDLSAEHLLESVEKFSEATNEADFYVVIIMSHGKDDDLVVGSEQGEIEVERIVSALVKSEQMSGKPKLIFFQMCRGVNVEKHNYTDTDAGGFETEDSSWINNLLNKMLHDGRILGSDVTETDAYAEEHLGSAKDVMLAFATQPGYVSFRDPKRGSWFIQSIKKIFSNHAATYDARKLMEMVKEDMKKQTAFAPGTDIDEGKVTMDGSDTFGKKNLKLFPGFPKPQNEMQP